MAIKIESNVKRILKKDGVIFNDFSFENTTISNIKEIIKKK